MDDIFFKLDNLVIIDSNFILLPIQFHIDYIEEIIYKIQGKTLFLIFQQVLDELEAKKKRYESKKSTLFENQYNTGLKYINLKKQNEINISLYHEKKKKNETTDDFLIRKSTEIKNIYPNLKIYLATNDIDLRKKARNRGISTIFLRQKKIISIEGPNLY
ncbi:MAG: hypothetical protein JXA99_12100 [Candidatus Lokiarchaeota archaeon]|nr:hypothetical protein [Candidatus Lokiarchaeota archaeon]